MSLTFFKTLCCLFIFFFSLRPGALSFPPSDAAPPLPGGDAPVDRVIQDGEDAQATENISKEEAAEMLLVCSLPPPGQDSTLTRPQVH